MLNFLSSTWMEMSLAAEEAGCRSESARQTSVCLGIDQDVKLLKSVIWENRTYSGA
jgi:hypothetical protein